MSEPFLSEIRIFSFSFAPKGWAFCNGQILPINQNQALFSLLGTTYGGDGRVNFALPNLQGRVATHMGDGLVLGERAGEQAHTLVVSEMPQHSHLASCNKIGGNSTSPAAALPAFNGDVATYAAAPGGIALAPATVHSVGGNQPHENMSPYLVLNFCIALQGIFPSQN
jgi:microcystin-dependent protein